MQEMAHREWKKYQKFVSSPMSPDKPVSAVPGIGRVYAQKLRNQGIGTAAKLYDEYKQRGGTIKTYLCESTNSNKRNREATRDAFDTMSSQNTSS